MTIETLRHYFGNLASFLGPSGAKKELIDDLTAVQNGLEPFATLSVRQFADFLSTAEEYHRTGILPASGKAPRKPAAPRAPKAPAVNVAEVATKVRAIYENAAKPETTPDMIAAEMQIIDALTKKPDLLEIAKILDADSGLQKKTIPAIKEAIKQAVQDMWDMSQRIKQ